MAGGPPARDRRRRRDEGAPFVARRGAPLRSPATESTAPGLRGVGMSAAATTGRVRWPGRAGHGFVAAYLVLLIAFGVVPTGYAIYFAFTDAANTFVGLANFAAAARDFRFAAAVGHVALYLALWLAALVVFVVGLALLLHRVAARPVSRTLRFLYYIPGALAGAASVMVWLF